MRLVATVMMFNRHTSKSRISLAAVFSLGIFSDWLAEIFNQLSMTTVRDTIMMFSLPVISLPVDGAFILLGLNVGCAHAP